MRTLQRELYLATTLFALTATPVFAQAPSIDVDSFRITVGENRMRKNSRRGPLAVLRFAGTGADNGIPFIYVSGGSGAGTSAIRGARLPFFEALRELGDVVAFDIRGTGRSTPR